MLNRMTLCVVALLAGPALADSTAAPTSKTPPKVGGISAPGAVPMVPGGAPVIDTKSDTEAAQGKSATPPATGSTPGTAPVIKKTGG